MKYLEHLPCPLLQPYVARIWELDYGIPQGKVIFQPDCCTATTHFIFCLQATWKIVREGKITSAYPANLITPLCVPVVNMLEGTHLSVGVEFTTTGFHRLWQIPIGAINASGACLHDLQAVIGEQALQLHHQLMEATLSATRVAILETFLLKHLTRKASKHGLVEGAVQVIEHKPIDWQVRTLSKHLHCTERTLERHFSEQVGISPKTYARIQRFIRVRNQLLSHTKMSWRNGLADVGYYDQAHFIREFLEFSGRTPAAYASQRNEVEEFFSKRFN